MGVMTKLARSWPLRLVIPSTALPLDASHIEAQAAYVLASARSFSAQIAGLDIARADGAILELGPGSDYANIMLVGEDFGRVLVADRYLSRWQEGYHPAFYRRVRELWGRPSRHLDAVIAAGGYGGAVRALAEPSERLASLSDGEVAFALSNAVLEHVADAAPRPGSCSG